MRLRVLEEPHRYSLSFRMLHPWVQESVVGDDFHRNEAKANRNKNAGYLWIISCIFQWCVLARIELIIERSFLRRLVLTENAWWEDEQTMIESTLTRSLIIHPILSQKGRSLPPQYCRNARRFQPLLHPPHRFPIRRKPVLTRHESHPNNKLKNSALVADR